MTKSRQRYVVRGIAVATTIGLFWGLIQSLICKGVASSEAAGWAQAIGTVAAIAGAVWVAFEQSRQADVAERKAVLERNVVLATRLRTLTVEAFIFGGQGIPLAKEQALRRRTGDLHISPKVSDDLLYRMAKLEADEIDPIRSTCIFDLRKALSELLAALAAAVMKPTGLSQEDVEKVKDLRERINSIDEQAKLFLKDAEQALAAAFPTVPH